MVSLLTRSADDPTIALLDAWSVLGDVLTFYTERIANEGFLRTATELRSVIWLAAMRRTSRDEGAIEVQTASWTRVLEVVVLRCRA